MDTNLLPHALIVMSAALVLAGMTQAVHASLRRKRQSAPALAGRVARAATQQQTSSPAGQISQLQDKPTHPQQQWRVVRLAEPQRLVIGVIAPDYVICGIPPRPGRCSGPPARNKLKSRAGNVWGDT